jgi:hypothetical protein
MDRKKLKLVLFSATIAILAIIVIALKNFGETSPVILKGTIKLDPALAEKAKSAPALYIIVRDLDSPMPMPWGAMVTRLPDVGQDPLYEFTLTKENLRLMNEGAAPKRLLLKARIDQDGVGGADMSGDLTGEVAELSYGQTGVILTIAHAVP